MDRDSSRCDIVLPVFNGLTHVKECINSILEHTVDSSYQLYIVDDCSDSFTRAYLDKIVRYNAQISLHRNPENLGFVKSCNVGVSLGKAPYVVLINSDVIVTPGWLVRLLQCAESDSCIASVNPLTNRASQINIPIAPGANFYGMDMVLAQCSPCKYPDVVTGVGFCMLLRRSALEKVGLFDEVYGRGYCEDSDLCMRLVAKGFRTVVADNVYVYHKGSTSFTDRHERYLHNRKIFDARWADEYKRQFNDFQAADPLKQVRTLFPLPERWDLIHSMRETYWCMRDCWRNGRPLGIVREAYKGLRRLPTAKRDHITPQCVERFTRPDRLRVTYVLHDLAMAGGVLSVVQLANELVLLGVEARIAALREHSSTYNWKFFSKPMIFRRLPHLLNHFPESDIAVATHWTTAPWVAHLVKSGRCKSAVYFIQDYECWFYPEGDFHSRTNVMRTYDLIPNKIVKSDWLKGLLERDGFSAIKIRLGMDLGIFYPREVRKPKHRVVLTMVRPSTPWRGLPSVIEALKSVKAALPEIEIVLFGEGVSRINIPFPYKHAGLVTDQNRLAELYSAADVFLDGSDWQAFGRPALEAMACGTACVLTNIGGVNEYARHGENCLLVPPKKPEIFAQAIVRILEDNRLKEILEQGGLKTVQDYCHKREAKETLAFFNQIAKV